MSNSEMLRIITWNIQSGTIEKKYPFIEEFNPDIVIFQEVAKPEHISDAVVWTGKNPKKGLAVIASQEYKISPYPICLEAPNYFLPVSIDGPNSFNLMAVWTHTDNNYVESFAEIFAFYREFLLKQPTIVAGDFNSNILWNKEHRRYSHSNMVEDFSTQFNLVSSYHAKNGIQHGEEKDATIFWRRNKNQPYHVDYCFVPKKSIIRDVVIGNYEEWKELSDHRPLIVDLNLEPRLP